MLCMFWEGQGPGALGQRREGEEPNVHLERWGERSVRVLHSTGRILHSERGRDSTEAGFIMECGSAGPTRLGC